jgi:hypothetical protein
LTFANGALEVVLEELALEVLFEGVQEVLEAMVERH